MPQFRFTAVDARGQPQSGRCDGLSVEAARSQLTERGLTVLELQPLDETIAATPKHVAAADRVELGTALAAAAETGRPIAAGLEALAAEATSARTRQVLLDLSRRVTAGESLDAALEAQQGRLPDAMPAVIRAGQRVGRLPLALLRYVDLERESRELQRSLWVSLLYPLVLMIGCLAILLLLAVYVIPMFDAIFVDFSVELPRLTTAVLGLSQLTRQFWSTLLVAGAALLIGGYFAIRLLVPAAVRSTLLDLIPLFGWMRRNFAIARFARLLALLMDGATPFPEAVRLAGAAANPGLEAAADRLAGAVESGIAPEEAAQDSSAWPRWLVPVFRWHDRGPAFSEALETAADLCVTRSQEQMTLATLVMEPAVIVCVALTIGGVVVSLFLPLVKLLNELS